MREVDVRPDEREYLARAHRCWHCGHLDVFHDLNSICHISGCGCDAFASARPPRMSPLARRFVTDGMLPEIGTPAVVVRLSSTLGFMVKDVHLDARRVGPGIYQGPVPGHGGDVVWIQHGSTQDTIGAYDTRDLVIPPTVAEVAKGPRPIDR